MTTKLGNQHNQKKNKSYYFDKENPSRTIILSGEVDDDSVYDVIQMISDINEYDDESDDTVKDYERSIALVVLFMMVLL